MQLQRDRLDAARVIAGDRVARRLERREERDERRARRRRGPKPERRLGDERERPLRADEQVGEPVARDVLDVLAAGPHDGPVREHDLQAEDRSRASAPYFTQHSPPAFVPRLPPIVHDLVARRVRRRRTAPPPRPRALSSALMTPGWVDDAQVRAVDLEDPVHPRERDRQRALDAGRATAEARAGAARDDRHAVRGARAGRARRPPRSSSGSATAPRQAGLEIGGLVEPIALAVDLVGQQAQAGQRVADRREECRGGRFVERRDGARRHGRFHHVMHRTVRMPGPLPLRYRGAQPGRGAGGGR